MRQYVASYQTLIQQGMHFKNRHYPVVESLAPAPLPIPCGKCNQFTHITEKCVEPIKCSKCLGPHHTTKCTSTLPEKCKTCGEEGHGAWSLKCKNRPTTPIRGIPNAKIKTLNKKTEEIDTSITKNSRIHRAVTIHDMVLHTYSSKINNEKCTNRQELINKLKTKFIDHYNIDTIVSFSGTHMYIIMLDPTDLSSPSPTEPIRGKQVTINHDLNG